jgi:hypothetical protein
LLVDRILPNLLGFITANLLALLVIAGFMWLSDRHFTLGLVHHLGRIFPQVAGFIGYSPAEN